MIPADVARDQGEQLAKAAEASPVRQVRVELRRRAREWERALDLLHDGGEDYEIEVVGAIAPGDRVLALVASYQGDEQEACPVVRVLHRDGQSTIHITPGTTGRDIYLNYASPSSPVVVQR